MRRLVFAVVVVSLLTAACASGNEAGTGEVGVTLGRVIEEIQPGPGTSIEFEIRKGDAVVLAKEYEVEFSGSDYRSEMETVFLEPDTYEIRATVNPTQATCEGEIDLTDKVDMTVSALIRVDCFLEIEETDAWHDTLGDDLPASTIEEFYGGGHCGWKEVRFIALGIYFLGDAYVRDPGGVFKPEYFVAIAARDRLGLEPDELAAAANLEPDDYLTLELDAELPAVRATLGYTRGMRELFTSIDGDYLYVVSPDGVERWPRAHPHPACA